VRCAERDAELSLAALFSLLLTTAAQQLPRDGLDRHSCYPRIESMQPNLANHLGASGTYVSAEDGEPNRRNSFPMIGLDTPDADGETRSGTGLRVALGAGDPGLDRADGRAATWRPVRSRPNAVLRSIP